MPALQKAHAATAMLVFCALVCPKIYVRLIRHLNLDTILDGFIELLA
jgi:hypothetical protein